MSDAEFIYDDEHHVVAYVAGVVSRIGENISAGIGIAFNLNHPDNYGGPIDGEFADKKAEIQAAIWAVKKLRNLDIFNINIATESIFLLDVINDWFPCYELFGFWGMCVPKEIRRDLTILHRVVMYNSLEEVCWTEIGDETKRLNSQKKQLIDLARKLAENGARQARTEN